MKLSSKLGLFSPLIGWFMLSFSYVEGFVPTKISLGETVSILTTSCIYSMAIESFYYSITLTL